MPLKILALYPGLNPTYDEVVYALTPLIELGVSVRVITSRLSALKSDQQGDSFENFKGVEIFRIFDDLRALASDHQRHLDQTLHLAREFAPDLLFVNSFHCLPLAHSLRRHLRVPLVLRLETADPLVLLRRSYYLGLPFLGRVLGQAKWRAVAAQVDAIMTNDPADLPHLRRLGGARGMAYYAGHCAQLPDDVPPAGARTRGDMIYIGSLIRHKNCSAWLKSVPTIFEHTAVERFTIIGRGPYLPVVEQLRRRFGQRIEHIPGVTRREALARLAQAYFAYTESSSGWGLLCDAWSTSTPVLCPQSTFNIVPGWTGMMPQNPAALVRTLGRLYDDPDYFRTLQQGGLARYGAEHTAPVVSRQYLQIFREVMAGARA